MAAKARQNARRQAAAALAIVFVATLLSDHWTTTFAQGADGLPVRLHMGSCTALEEVRAELTGVGAGVDPAGTPVSAPERAGSAQALPIAISATPLDVKMSDLLDTPHAIVVYQSDEAMDQPLVCGNVGGAMMMQMPGMAMPGDETAIWLAPVAAAPYAGMALLRSEVGGSSTITIYLSAAASGSANSGEETPEATPETG